MYALEMFDDKEMQAGRTSCLTTKLWILSKPILLQSTKARRSLTRNASHAPAGMKGPMC
jgi:hypothetical protein